MRSHVVGALVVFSFLSAPPSHAQVGPGAPEQAIQSRAERHQAFVSEIIAKWGDFVAETYRTDATTWGNNMSDLLARASLDTLHKAALARTFAEMNNALLGSDDESAQLAAKLMSDGRDTVQRLGEVAADLVFVPVTPCRVLDTRVAGGVIPANTTRDFDITAVGSFAFQGGDASNCNVGAAGSFAAAVLNFTVVTPSAAGYITAFPYLGTQPLAATVNYSAGDIRGNLAVVKLDQGASASEMSVYSFAQTHLVADIVGYYINPEATQPECTNTTVSSFSIAAGTSNFFNNPACPGGYEATIPYCWTAASGVYSQGSGHNGNIPSNATFCAWQNTTGTSQTVLGGNVCCRVPGR